MPNIVLFLVNIYNTYVQWPYLIPEDQPPTLNPHLYP